MASACVNNVGITPGKFSSYGWLSPRVSFSRDDDAKSGKGKATAAERKKVSEKADLEKEAKDVVDFEFRLEDPVGMLPADELFSDGKLMPMMHVSTVAKLPSAAPEVVRNRRITEVLSGSVDPCLFSPKAPRCASRWKEIFGLKKLQQNCVVNINNEVKISSGGGGLASSNNSLKNFLHRKSKSSSSSSDAGGLSLPLLRDSESESLSMSSSSRLSLSSSSSGHEVEDFPRLSLDSDKQNINIKPISLLKCITNSNSTNPNPPPRVRLVKPRASETAGGARMVKSPMRKTALEQTNASSSFGVSIDSPRMNPSGKIVFHSLERSSSSPSSFNGGPKFKPSGMERPCSANVRVAPVLNVPVCSLSKSGSVLGFGQLFSSQQKRDSNSGISRSYQIINNNNTRRSRTDRI